MSGVPPESPGTLRPKRAFFARFRLRSLMLLVALVALTLGAAAFWQRQAYYREQAAWHAQREKQYLDSVKDCEKRARRCAEAELEFTRMAAETGSTFFQAELRRDAQERARMREEALDFAEEDRTRAAEYARLKQSYLKRLWW